MAPCFYDFNSGTVESGNTIGYLPRHARLPLSGGWRGTGQICRWPWKVKSTMRKDRSSPNTTQNWFLLGKRVATYNFAASLLCTPQSWFRTFFDHGSWRLSQSCHVCAAVFAVKTWAQTGANSTGSMIKRILGFNEMHSDASQVAQRKSKAIQAYSWKSDAFWWVMIHPMSCKCN